MFTVAASECSDDTLLQELVRAVDEYERFLAGERVQTGAGKSSAAAPAAGMLIECRQHAQTLVLPASFCDNSRIVRNNIYGQFTNNSSTKLTRSKLSPSFVV